ncbi:expressed protein [Phakopsora pachyrhizi]|uniref:Expressed protein n=1 Tax=Phakopsora pachyrhizi TaxID=170000 RepID=A0AAV0AWD0_PHAPC|nr:expressed protein [Phakopsora pachyrhizi]
MMIWRAFKSHIDLLKKVNEISGYVSKWLQFQSLWYLEADYLYSQLGKSLSAWQQILSEIRKTRLNFDNSESFQDFGVCKINYEQFQAKVSEVIQTITGQT